MASPKPTSVNSVRKKSSVARANPRVSTHAQKRAVDRFGIAKRLAHKWIVGKFRESTLEAVYDGQVYHRRAGGVRLVVIDWVVVTVLPSESMPVTKIKNCGCRFTYFEGKVDSLSLCARHRDLAGQHTAEQIAVLVENDQIDHEVETTSPSDTRQSRSSPKSSKG